MKVIGYSIAVIGLAMMIYAWHIERVLLQPERRFPAPEAGQTHRVEVKGVSAYATQPESWAQTASFPVGCILLLCGGAIAIRRKGNFPGSNA